MSEKTKPKAFHCYLNNITILEHLTDEQAGQLWKLLYNLAVNDVRGESDNPMVSMAFDLMAQKLESDFAAYAKKSKANSANGKKGAIALNERRAKSGERQAKSGERQAKSGERQANSGERQANFGERRQYKDEYEDKYEYEYEYEDEDKYEYENEDEDKYEYKDEDENKDENEKTSACADAVVADDVVKLYHHYCPSLPSCTLSKRRERLIEAARGALCGTGFEEYFQRVARSDFLTGKKGNWNGCGFDWLMAPSTVEKVLDGAYDNHHSTAQSQSSASYNLEELEKIDTLDFID